MSGQLQLLDDPDAPVPGPIRVQASAVISADELYRYELRRVWDAAKPLLCFTLLNPSTADGSVDDQTVRKCIGFARLLGFGGIVIVNLFAWRTSSPAVLSKLVQNEQHHASIIGPENRMHLLGAMRAAELVIAGWGVHGTLNGRGRVVAQLAANAGIRLSAIGTTQDGFPRHPLYMPYDSRPTPWVPPISGPDISVPTRVGKWQTADPCTTYVGRGSKWGNPYVFPGKARKSRHSVREVDDPLAAYEAYLLAQPHLMRDLPSLKGHVLGCYCVAYDAEPRRPAPGKERCHAQILARLADQAVEEETRA